MDTISEDGNPGVDWELDLSANDEAVLQQAEAAVKSIQNDKRLPERKFLDISPEMDVLYETKFEARCRICNHPLREEAERLFIINSQNTNAVVKWFETQGEHVTWESVSVHMKKHCDFGDPEINFLARMKAREDTDDLASIRRDRLTWGMDALTSIMMDLGSFNLKKDPNRAASISAQMIKGIQVMANIQKQQDERMGSIAQAEAQIEAYKNKILQLLSRLMEIVDDDAKQLIIQTVTEFQQEIGI